MTNLHALEIDDLLWPYVYGGPGGTGKIKVGVEDFVVEEQLPFEPEGKGEHVFLRIEKKGENTEFVTRLLARFAGIRQRDVSVAGLKDRHALTRQWFSVWLPGKQDPDWNQIETENIKVLQSIRHARKLKRGVLSGNLFQIRIREWQGDKEKLEIQLQCIKAQGFANYFGSQRFGHQGQNVNKAMALFAGAKIKREQRSLYLSAVRSFLFNQLLSNRVAAGNWNKAISGDILMFDQSHSYFHVDQPEEAVIERVERQEIHPAGILYGEGRLETTDQALIIEQTIINRYPELADGLLKFNVSADRRTLRVMVNNLQWQFENDSTLLLKFFLPAGSYATALVRELIELR